MDPSVTVEEEISVPGLVGGPVTATAPSAKQNEDEELESIEETALERLYGLTEMMPDRFWSVLGRTGSVGYWFVRRSAWVIGTTMALMVLPPVIEQQRLEFEEMRNIHKKQMLLGPSQSMLPGGIVPS